MGETELEIWQDGQCVASVSSEDHVAAFVEASHYALVYGRDGPVELYQINRIAGRKVRCQIEIAGGTKAKPWSIGPLKEPRP